MKSKPLCLHSWSTTVLKKLVTLGIPYFVFSIVTWLLKNVFSDSVNHQSTELFKTLFLDPESPYWYLYALFFLFMITPTFPSNKKALIGLFVAVVMKVVSIAIDGVISLFPLSTVLANELWLVMGMVMCKFGFPTEHTSSRQRKIAIGLGVCFIVLSALIAGYQLESRIISTLMGLLGCIATILLALNMHRAENVGLKELVPFMMPVFLMHTIFAAGLRIVLIKFGVYHVLPHVLFGTIISFAGPIFAARIMEHFRLDILLYPGKYIHF